MRSIIIISLITIGLLTSGHCPPANGNPSTNDRHKFAQGNPTDIFIKDLKVFVRSIIRQKYQPESYWVQVDALWESIQERKQNLESQFDEDQRRQIRKWEKRYHQTRNKRSKQA